MNFIRPTHMDIYRTLVLSLTLGLLAVLFINQQHNTTVQLQVMAANAKTRTQQIHDLQKHLDCVVALASQPNHQALYIKDIQSCQITNSGQVTTVSTPAKPNSLSVGAPQPQSKVSVSSSPPQSAPSSDNKQQPTTPPSPQPPSLLQQLVDGVKKLL